MNTFNVLFALIVMLTVTQNSTAEELTLFIGGYSKNANEGVSLARFNTQTGELSNPSTVAATPNPSFLAIHPNNKFLYTANESGEVGGEKKGGISAFEIEAETGNFKPLNAIPVGGGLCHVNVDATGKYLFAAAYGGGHVGVWSLNADGSIGERTAFEQHMKREVEPPLKKGPHAHQFVLSPDNRFAFAVDLGLDKVFVHRFDATSGKLIANDPAFAETALGAGPRHMTFSPDGNFAYLINEYGNTVNVFRYHDGALQNVETVSTLPAEFQGKNYTAEILVHPSGKWVYGSNRGHDSIAVFARDVQQGTLQRIGEASTEGRYPRNFVLSPDGNWLLAANQKDSSIIVFRIDAQTGQLTKTSLLTGAPGEPTCLRFWTP